MRQAKDDPRHHAVAGADRAPHWHLDWTKALESFCGREKRTGGSKREDNVLAARFLDEFARRDLLLSLVVDLSPHQILQFSVTRLEEVDAAMTSLAQRLARRIDNQTSTEFLARSARRA